MLGWDVTYTWPYFEPTTPQPPDSRPLVMGNPRGDGQTPSNNGETSSTQPVVPQSAPRSPIVLNPPPYASVAAEETSPPRFSVAQRRPRAPRLVTVTQRVRPSRWPHKASSAFACLACVIGVSNVSRFSMLVYIYKGMYPFF